MKKIVFLILTHILISCGSFENFETIGVNNFSLDLPTYLSKTTNLNNSASLQYQNVFKELYIIAIDEDKNELGKALHNNGLDKIYSNDFNGYVDLLKIGLENDIEMENETVKDTLINGLQTKLIKFEGKVETYNVFYAVAYVNGVDNYYQIMSWTLLDKKEEYETTIDKMIFSFKVKNMKKESKKKAQKNKKEFLK
ncbi:hypothetical protein [Flavobacterium sp. J27]|uniref:hypothetical protein n=1 Tax=Flavobacterium sp. J27 TaxID=2060419 RepID=UPI001030E44D|nr:hypothetical protein [Flavobacterium sp. J27]